MSYESGLVERLETLTASPPVPAFDVDRAIAEGLRGRRRRTFVALSWSIALLLACSVGVAVGVGHVAGSGPATVTAPTDTAFPENDPIQVGAEFGWLPSGMKAADNYALGWISSDDGAWQAARTSSGATELVDLRTLSADLNAQQAAAVMGAGLGPGAAPVAQASINGRPAYWVVAKDTPANVRNATMIWRLSDGRWGGLWETSLPAGESADIMRHIAETVTPGSTPQSMPMRLSGLPKGTTVDAGGFQRPGSLTGSPWQASLSIRYGDRDFDFVVALPGYADLYGARMSNGGTLAVDRPECETVNGLEACVSAQGNYSVPTALSKDGLKGLLKHLTLMGPDPSTWTTDVVRTS